MSVEYFERSEGGADFDAEQLSEVSLDFDFDLPMDWFSTPTDTSGTLIVSQDSSMNQKFSKDLLLQVMLMISNGLVQ